MIANFNQNNRKDDIKLLCLLIVGFLFLVWLCTPPGNKIAQIAMYGNNTKLIIAKMTKPSSDLNEWLFHRNNAVYFVRMNNQRKALQEINKAIDTFPVYLPEARLQELYSTRAEMRLYYKDYKGALSDYMKLNNLTMMDKFKVALLFKQTGNNRYALSYCNDILDTDTTAYVGYACMADIYAGVGKYATAVRVYDLLIDRTKKRAKYYAERAEYKRLSGDIKGYNEDLDRAKSLSQNLDENFLIIKETLNPKNINLRVLKD